MSPEVGKRNSKMLDVPVRDSSAGSVSPKLSRDDSQFHSNAQISIRNETIYRVPLKGLV